ncbi:MAG: hypothetical protein ACI4J7_07750 [Ruminiclostridium sp.]
MKREKKSVKEKNPAAVVAIVLAIIAVLLLIVLADMCFVPFGSVWEEMKADYAREFGCNELPPDSQIWKEMKEVAVTKADMFPSGFYCWFCLKSMWQEQQEKYRLRDEKIAASNLTAEEIKAVFEEYLAENDLSAFAEADISKIHEGNLSILFSSNSDFLFCEDESLIQRISEATADWESFSAKVLIHDNSCTAAAFAPEIKRALVPGTDCPYINSEGGFDYEQPWGYDSALAQNNFVLGLAPPEPE